MVSRGRRAGPRRCAVQPRALPRHRYRGGAGHAKAARWGRAAAGQGFAAAQCNPGARHANGTGVARGHAGAARWCRGGPEQGLPKATGALEALASCHLPGTSVVLSGLQNGRRGVVSRKLAKKPGRAAVMLEGDTLPTSVKLENLRWWSAL